MTSTTRVMNISSIESKIKVDCTICAEEISKRKIVECPFCQFQACDKCVETFLLGIDDDRPRCMNPECKKIWTYDYLTSNLSHSFHNKKYRDRRASLLHEREKSLLPGTQPLVVAEILRQKNNVNISNLCDENAMYRELIKLNDEKIKNLRLNTRITEEKEEKRSFTRSCPVENCRGFLSTTLKCGICSVYACKNCHLPKQGKHDEDHKCDPGLVATVKLLANDTKPCPACATPIYKIHGCDQMYCTVCHTPFSWQRGTIERGVIHNPHYYDFQRDQNGGTAPRRMAPLGCGGPPLLSEVTRKLRGWDFEFKHVSNAHRLIFHINNVELLQHYRNTVGDMDNSQLRVDYLMNKITEKQWISKLKTKMKKQEKDGEIHMVLSMFASTMSDMFGNILIGDFDDVHKYIRTMYELRNYTNNTLRKIGLNYENIYPCISDDFEFHQNAKPKKIIYK